MSKVLSLCRPFQHFNLILYTYIFFQFHLSVCDPVISEIHLIMLGWWETVPNCILSLRWYSINLQHRVNKSASPPPLLSLRELLPVPRRPRVYQPRTACTRSIRRRAAPMWLSLAFRSPFFQSSLTTQHWARRGDCNGECISDGHGTWESALR